MLLVRVEPLDMVRLMFGNDGVRKFLYPTQHAMNLLIRQMLQYLGNKHNISFRQRVARGIHAKKFDVCAAVQFRKVINHNRRHVYAGVMDARPDARQDCATYVKITAADVDDIGNVVLADESRDSLDIGRRCPSTRPRPGIQLVFRAAPTTISVDVVEYLSAIESTISPPQRLQSHATDVLDNRRRQHAFDSGSHYLVLLETDLFGG